MVFHLKALYIIVIQVLFYLSLTYFSSLEDKQRLASLAQKGNDENGSSNGPYAIERAIRNLNKCAAYCMNEIDCRRTQVLEYFGENFPSEKCKNTCDNCRRGSGAVVWLDVTEYAVMIVRIVSAIVEAKLPKVTINMLRTLLSNSKDKKLERYRTLLERMRIPFDITDSRGKVLSKVVCEKILHGMVVSDYLREDSEMTASSFTAEYVSVGSEANSLLNGSGKLSISVHSPKKKTVTKSLPEDIEDEEVSLSGEQQYPPSIKSSSPDPKLASSTIKSHAGMLPSNKPWEANKSGKLALKKSDSRRSNQINLTESDDEFEESGRRKRMNISSANMISSDLSIESEMSPEILVRAQPSKRRAVNAVEEYILNVKQRNALRSWLNEYRKRFVSDSLRHLFILDGIHIGTI